MNKKQKIIKKIAKRAKARQNKIETTTVGAKPRYISKAERARLEEQNASSAEQENQVVEVSTDAK